MIITQSWVYLDLQKTGCTFLREKLLQIFPSIGKSKSRKHSRCKDFHNGIRLMTIRDPFDYYYSLWSYGLDKRGAYHSYLKKRLKASKYDQIYSNPCPSGFQAFIHEACFRSKNDLYTRRVLKMILPKSEDRLLKSFLGNANPICPENCDKYLSDFYPNILLPTDSLSKSFHAKADSGALDRMSLPGNWKHFFPLDSGKVNASTRGSSAQLKDVIRQQCADEVKQIHLKCFLPTLLYQSSKVA